MLKVLQTVRVAMYDIFKDIRINRENIFSLVSEKVRLQLSSEEKAFYRCM